MLSDRMRAWATDSWTPNEEAGISIEELAECDNQSVLIFAEEVAELEAENAKLKEMVTVWDVGLDVKQRLVVAEARAERLREMIDDFIEEYRPALETLANEDA